MATVATRSISGKDYRDKVAIKVDKETYADKYGLITVTVTNYYPTTSGTTTNAGTLTIQPPNYYEDTDNKVVDAETVNSAVYNSGSPKSVNKKYNFAVNNGVPGPSVLQQPDGSWDLLHAIYEQAPDNALAAHTITVTYTVAFADQTP